VAWGGPSPKVCVAVCLDEPAWFRATWAAQQEVATVAKMKRVVFGLYRHIIICSCTAFVILLGECLCPVAKASRCGVKASWVSHLGHGLRYFERRDLCLFSSRRSLITIGLKTRWMCAKSLGFLGLRIAISPLSFLGRQHGGAAGFLARIVMGICAE